MRDKNVLKGVLFVGLGAAMYGMLATFVKMAYNHGYTTAEVTSAQFTIGLVGLFLISSIGERLSKKEIVRPKKLDVYKLVLAGTSYGGTSLFYYLSVQYIDVSIAIVMLMQSVWMSVVLEGIINKELPNTRKIIATVVVLGGTLLATNAIDSNATINIKGIFWGLLAATSYTITMFTSNKVANYLPATKKSLIMLCGGGLVIFSFLFLSQVGPYYFDSIRSFSIQFGNNPANIRPFDFSIYYTFGLFLAICGTVLPPIFLNKGFPHSGLGLGSIVSSIELPVSVGMAYILLNESVLVIQWIGISLILCAIVLMNLKKVAKAR